MHVGSEYITVACPGTRSIRRITYTGDLVHSLKYNFYPRLCHTGSDAVLVAQWWDSSLELQNEGELSHVLLEPPPKLPRDAVFIGGALFALEWLSNSSINRIIKYVCKN